MVEKLSTISVELVYADTGKQILKELTLPVGTTLAEAVLLSGVAAVVKDLDALKKGIYGELADDKRVLLDGDRVEIYRPLKATVVRFGRGLVLHIEVRCFKQLVVFDFGGQAAFERAADDERALGGEGRFAGLDHLPDFGDQTGRVGDIGHGGQEELRRDGVGFAF